MSKTLKYRDYQTEAMQDIADCYNQDNLARVLLVQPTGTGKTLTVKGALESIPLRQSLLKGKNRFNLRVIFKSHRHRLLTQARRAFESHYITERTLENWKNNETTLFPVEVVYQSYSQKIEQGVDFDLIVWEEVHHEACKTAQEFLEFGGNYPSLGITATPDRNDNCIIKFDFFVEPISRVDAVTQGFICETDVRTIVDTSGKDKSLLLNEVLNEFHSQMKQTLIFVRTKREIKKVVDYINNELNLVAIGLDNQNDNELDVILDEFSTGKYQFIVNCKRIGEGVDLAGATDVILARNVGSYTDLNQYIGRVARPDVLECRVWEFVNPMSGDNLDAQEVVGIPKSHLLISKKDGKFITRNFL